MEYGFHYTSYENWEKIQRAGFLEPRTVFVDGRVYENDNYTLIETTFHKSRFYTVAILEPDHRSWARYGLMDRLIAYTTGKVLVRFPIKPKNGTIVREHKHLSPKECIALYGEDVTQLSEEKILLLKQEKHLQHSKQQAKYYMSGISLENYDGSYEVPEIWFPHPVSIDDLVIVRVR